MSGLDDEPSTGHIPFLYHAVTGSLSPKQQEDPWTLSILAVSKILSFARVCAAHHCDTPDLAAVVALFGSASFRDVVNFPTSVTSHLFPGNFDLRRAGFTRCRCLPHAKQT